MDAPRTLEQREKDTLHRLEHDVDAADGGVPCLAPLSIHWDGRAWREVNESRDIVRGGEWL